MRRVWGVGYVGALAVLAVVAVLDVPFGALLGALVLSSAAFFAWLASMLVFVHERTALVVLSARNDAIRDVVLGPDRIFLLPFLEKAGPVLDTSFKLVQVELWDSVRSDQSPAPISFAVTVGYRLAPRSIPTSQLVPILPQIAGGAGALVELHTEYCLRCLIGELDLSRRLNHHRQRLEHWLRMALSPRLAALAMTVDDLQLVIRPLAGVQEAEASAQQQRISLELQVDQLQRVLDILRHQSEEARSLALLELARCLRTDGLAWVDMSHLFGSAPGGGPWPPGWPFPSRAGVGQPSMSP